MDSNSWKEIDNSKPIPEPIIFNVKNAADDYVSEIAQPDEDDSFIKEVKDSYMTGAQYGYNIAQVFVNDLRKLIEENNTTYLVLKKKLSELEINSFPTNFENMDKLQKLQKNSEKGIDDANQQVNNSDPGKPFFDNPPVKL
jgi:hypothetical protein